MLSIIITVGAIVATTFVVYFKWKFSYWKKRNVFTEPPTVLFGNAKDSVLGKQSLGEYVYGLHKKLRKKNLRYGGFYMCMSPNFVVVDLDLIRSILTTDFQYFTDHDSTVNEKDDPLSAHLFALKGAKWRALRMKLTPLFSSGKMKMMFPTLVDCTKGISPLLDEYESRKECFDIKEVFARYTTDVIASVGFGIECNCLKDPDSEFRKYGKKVFDDDFINFRRMVNVISPSILKFLKISLTGKDVERFFIGIVKETIQYREKYKVERKDFMQLLLGLRNTELKLEGYHDNNKNQLSYYQKGLSLNEIAAQAFVFFVAGFETSSTTLNWLMYELAQHVEIQEKLRKEILDVLEKTNGEITYEAVKEMRYLDNCINETLRKYPPAAALPRECTKDYRVPGTDLVIEKGTSTLISVYAIHHDPEIYPDPEKFDPDRFNDENKEKRPSMTFIPFGEGPRICIGLRLGVLQTKVGLIEMLRKYRFTLNPKTKVPMEFNAWTIVLSAKEGVWVDAHKI